MALVKADLQQIHLCRREVLVSVDVSKAPDHGGKDGQDVSLGRQLGSIAEALLLHSGGHPSGAELRRRVIKGASQSLSARHLLSALGSAEVDLHAGVELAKRSVEELAGRIRAAVGRGTLIHLGSGRKLTLQEAVDLLGRLVGDEEGHLLLGLGLGGGGRRGIIPRVLVVRVRHDQGVDEILEDDLLVGGVGVRVPDGGDLVHGAVEEGGVHLGEVGLNCGDGVRHF